MMYRNAVAVLFSQGAIAGLLHRQNIPPAPSVSPFPINGSAANPPPNGTAGGQLTTEVVYTTNIYTVTSCAPDVTDCPGRTTSEVSPVSVNTVYVTASSGSGLPPPVPTANATGGAPSLPPPQPSLSASDSALSSNSPVTDAGASGSGIPPIPSGPPSGLPPLPTLNVTGGGGVQAPAASSSSSSGTAVSSNSPVTGTGDPSASGLPPLPSGPASSLPPLPSVSPPAGNGTGGAQVPGSAQPGGPNSVPPPTNGSATGLPPLPPPQTTGFPAAGGAAAPTGGLSSNLPVASGPPAPFGNSSVSQTTLTVEATTIRTVISCAPTVTSCPAASESSAISALPSGAVSTVVVTDTIAQYTTICPVTAASSLSSSIASSFSSAITTVTGELISLDIHIPIVYAYTVWLPKC